MSKAVDPIVEQWATRRDAEAFKVIVDRHSRMVYATCRRILGNATEAEDATQECFEALAQTKLTPAHYLGPWLYRVATNLCLKRLRSARRRRQREKDFVAGQPVQTEASWNDIYAYVDGEISDLHEKFRIPVVAHFLEGQTHEAIAKSLGLSRPAVTYRIEKGVQLIGKALRKRGISVAAVALSSLLGANLATAAPLPASLVSSLGKLVLAHSGKSVIGFSVKTLGGLLVMKKVTIGVTALLLAMLGLWMLTQPNQVEQAGTSGPEKSVGITQETESRPPEEASVTPSPRASADETAGLTGAASETTPEPDTGARASAAATLEEGGIADPALYCSISGAVTDREWKPIPGARVIVIAYGYDREDRDMRDPYLAHAIRTNRGRHFQTITDHRGKYKIADISFEKSILVLAYKESYTARYARLGDGTASIMLSPGDMLNNIDIRLSTGTVLRGRVLSPRGAPVSDAVVSIMGVGTTRSSRQEGLVSFGGEGLTYTDQVGRFSLGFYPKADYCNLCVTSEAYGVSSFPMVAISDKEIELRMHGPASMMGTITQADGTPANDKIVTMQGLLYMGDGPGSSGSYTSTHSAPLDNQGQYKIANIDPGQTYKVHLATLDARPLTDQIDIPDFTSGETRTWDYVLHGQIMVRGRVLGEFSGKPVQDVEVECRKDGEHLSSNEIQQGSVRVNDDGTYEFKILTGPGRYSFDAGYIGLPFHGETLSSGSDFEGGLERGGQDVELKGGDEIELDLALPDPYTIQVRVVDSQGNAVQDAFMRVRMGTGWHGPSGRTNEEGRFSFSGFAPDVDGWMDCEHNSGYVDTLTAVYVGEPGEIIPEETIVVNEETSITGLAIDHTGMPLSSVGLTITAYDPHQGDARIIRTDENGNFTAARIPATDVSLEITFEREGQTYRWTSTSQTLPIDYVTDLGVITLTPEDGEN